MCACVISKSTNNKSVLKRYVFVTEKKFGFYFADIFSEGRFYFFTIFIILLLCSSSMAFFMGFYPNICCLAALIVRSPERVHVDPSVVMEKPSKILYLRYRDSSNLLKIAEGLDGPWTLPAGG